MGTVQSEGRMLIDSHCHLSFKDYPEHELDFILSRAVDNDVTYLINIGAGEGYESNEKAVALAKQYPQIYATVGIHPHDAQIVDDSVVQKIRQLAATNKVVAMGEIGLDFYYEHSPKNVQEKVFRTFIKLAEEVNKPIMIHDRGAGHRTYEILKETLTKNHEVMIHCFTGDAGLAKKYLDLGCILSFTGIITFKKSHELREIVKWVPIERMLIETDAPYLAPEPHRGKKNEPAHVKLVAQKIAEIKALNFEDVARITTLNAKRFFNLPLPDLVPQIAYAIRDSLYLNITNRCTLACRFCPKFVDYEVKGYYLKLPKEPTVDEVLSQIDNLSRYQEIVFCGYGEPTRRLEAVLQISRHLKQQNPVLRIRLNTDGLGNLVHERNIVPELAQVIDAMSVSLNAADAKTYAKYCPSKYGEAAYPAVKDFIREATKHVQEVIASIVGLPDVDREACRKIAEEELGAKFRYREYNNVG